MKSPEVENTISMDPYQWMIGGHVLELFDFLEHKHDKYGYTQLALPGKPFPCTVVCIIGEEESKEVLQFLREGRVKG